MKEKNMRKYPLQIIIMTLAFAVNLCPPILISYLIDEIAIGKNYNALPKWFAVTLTVSVLGSLLNFLILNYMPMMIGIQNSFCLEKKCVRNILRMNQSIYSGKEKGYYYNICENSTSSYGDLHEELHLNLVCNILYVVGVLGVVTYTDISFGIFFLCYGAVLVLIALKSANPLFQMQKDVVEVQDAALSKMRNVIENKSGINAIHTEKFFVEEYEKSCDQYQKYVLRYRFFECLSADLPGIASKISTVLFLALGVVLIMRGEITTGLLVMGYQYMGYLAEPINVICQIAMRYKANKVHIERVDKLTEEAEIPKENLEFNTESECLLKADNFDFFKGKEKDDFLYHISHMELKKNGLYVIKGDNGSGKSMLLNLLLGNVSKKDCSGAISVAENINETSFLTYPFVAVNGDFDRNLFGISRNAELEKLLNIDFEDRSIKANPINLSYGQQQKLALMRVFGLDAPIIFLDEPLSNLDIETQRRLIAYISSLKGKKTIVVIMHGEELDEIADGIVSIKNHQMQLKLS